MRRAAKRSNGHAAVGVEALGGLDEAEGAGPGQLLAVDVAGEVAGDLQHDVLDEREVLLDERCGRRVVVTGHVALHFRFAPTARRDRGTSYDE